MKSRQLDTNAIGALALLLLAAALPAGAEQEAYGASYGYLRQVEGSVTLIQTGSGTRTEADRNQPLLAGDHLWASPDGRAEALLADRNLLRLDGDTEVVLDALAASPDTNDTQTRLRLLAGTLQVVVAEDALGSDLPRIDTPNSTVYLRQSGSYLVSAERSGWSQVVVRDGYAEVLTPRGSVVVRRGEQARIEGQEWVSSSVAAAGPWTGLERWGDDLEQRAARAEQGYVDDSLRYAAASLYDSGTWVTVDRRPAWRPRVAAGWQPYSSGYWTPTPSGLTWVSYEPWGWVPYHYGSWDFVAGYGWVWFPGHVYAPAWVYWYWSPSYVGWCPVGYYTRYYYPRYRDGFRFGVYGWAGGDWGFFAHWNFIPARRLHYRDQARYVRPSYVLGKESGLRALPRGIITTDTRGITGPELADPDAAVRVLRTRPALAGSRDLTDVTPFVARQELPPQVARQVVETRPAVARPLATPLRPGQVDDRPAKAPARALERPVAGERPTMATRPAETSSDSGARIERRPAEVARPAERPSSDAGSSRTLDRRPADWRELPAKPADIGSGARIERRPAEVARPTGSGSGVRIERRPATVERPAATGSSSGSGVRIERRPATAPPSGGGVESRPVTGTRPQTPSKQPTSGVRIERRPAPAPTAPPTAAERPTTVRRPAGVQSPGRTSPPSPVIRQPVAAPRQPTAPAAAAPRQRPTRPTSPAAAPRPSEHPAAAGSSRSGAKQSGSRGTAKRGSAKGKKGDGKDGKG